MTESVPTTNFSASWIRVDQTSNPSFYSALLDATRAQGLDQARREPSTVFGPLDLRAGLRVLDVGCGTGDYLRIMAPLVAPGPAVGIDLSATLIDVARQRSATDEANMNSSARAPSPPGKAPGSWTTCVSAQAPAGTSWPAPTTR
jgi:2-polyprenyl-3-methyl-5-hydroxy-6-metoxy-1,4-benzoquinol methylase